MLCIGQTIRRFSFSLTVTPVLAFCLVSFLIWSNVEFYNRYYIPSKENFTRTPCKVLDCWTTDIYCPDCADCDECLECWKCMDCERTCNTTTVEFDISGSDDFDVYEVSVPSCDDYPINKTLECFWSGDIEKTLAIAPPKDNSRKTNIALFKLGITACIIGSVMLSALICLVDFAKS